MNHAGWIARREFSRLGWQGFLGIALLVFAAGLALSALWPAHREVGELKDQVAQLRKQLKAVGPGDAARASPTREAQIETFYAFFPRPESIPDWIGQVHTAALRSGLVLEKGDYQLVRPKGARLARYQIQLPVKGRYGELRAFIAEVLSKVPAAAVEDVVIKRESIGEGALEAKIRLSVYLGVAP